MLELYQFCKQIWWTQDKTINVTGWLWMKYYKVLEWVCWVKNLNMNGWTFMLLCQDLIRLGVRTIGDRVRLRDACRRVYTRSSTSISLEDTHRTSSNRPGLLFSPSVSSTGIGEGRTGSRRRQSTVMVLVTLIEKEKVIIHGLGNLCVCQIVMPKKY